MKSNLGIMDLLIKQFIIISVFITYSIIYGQINIVEAFPNLSFTIPLDLQHAPDGSDRIFVVEKQGHIYVFENDPDVTEKTLFLDISDSVSLEGDLGLHGLAFHPDFANNGYFFVNYTKLPPWRTVISRFEVSAVNFDVADVSSEHVIIEINQPFSNHNDGQIVFGPNNYLCAVERWGC